jgi:hypothetical protein
VATVTGAEAQDPAKPWEAGAYSFSDELGGFRIAGVSGKGTRDDPIVITDELNSASPVTLFIRATQILKPFSFVGDSLSGFTHFRLRIRPLLCEVESAAGEGWVSMREASASAVPAPVRELVQALRSGAQGARARRRARGAPASPRAAAARAPRAGR